MSFFNRLIVLFAALFISLVATAQGETLVNQQAKEREIRESEQFVIDRTATSRSYMDELFKPIDDQLSALQNQQKLAQKTQIAEYFLLAVLFVFLLTLLYVLSENARSLERGKALEKQKYKLDLLIANVLPEQSAKEYIATGEIAPTIWGDSLVVIVEILLPNPLPKSRSRGQIEEVVIRENQRLIVANGLDKIRTSGDRLLTVCKSHNLIPQQQFERAMSYVSSLQEVLDKSVSGASIRTGMSFGDVVFGALGDSSVRVDILGLAIDQAAKCSYQGAPGEVWITDRVKGFLRPSENYMIQESVSIAELDCTMMKITTA
jgi:class 3 adenylate cyclase